MGVLSVVLAAMLLILALLWWPSLIFAAFFFWLGVKLVKNAKSYSGQSILRDISGADLDDALKKFIINSFEIRSSQSSVSSIAEDVEFIQLSAFSRCAGAHGA